MIPFSENLRYEYDLTPESVVMDVGAHKGTFSWELLRKYKCHINCYEPIKEFHAELAARFEHQSHVNVFKYGLGGYARNEIFKVKGDMSGKFADQGPEQEVLIIGIRDELASLGNPDVALLKINIEGGEYELLEAIDAEDLTKKFRDIQVQFHGCIPDATIRRHEIRVRLAETHELTYDEPFIWENWRRK